MSIFPSEIINVNDLIQETVATSSSELPLAKEYAWDFDNNDFLLVDGKNIIVSGKEAVKVWIWKVLQTAKNRYKAYTSNFGNELENLIAQGLSNAALRSETERYLKETILVNSYINGISDINLSFDDSMMNVEFTATTVYGEVTIIA